MEPPLSEEENDKGGDAKSVHSTVNQVIFVWSIIHLGVCHYRAQKIYSLPKSLENEVVDQTELLRFRWQTGCHDD